LIRLSNNYSSDINERDRFAAIAAVLIYLTKKDAYHF